MNSIFHSLQGVVDLVGNGSRQTASGGELFHLEHSPFQLKLLQFFPGGKIAQHGHGVGYLSARVVNLARPGGIFHVHTGALVVQVESAVVLIGKGKSKRIEVGVEFGLVLYHLGILSSFRRTEQILGHGIQQNNLGRIVGNDDRVTDVLDDQVEAIAILADDFFGVAELLQIGANFFIGATQVSYVTHDRDHAGTDCFFAEGGSRDGFEKHFFAFHDIHQSEITRGASGADDHGGQSGGKQQIVQLYGPLASLADAFGNAEETLRSLILRDHTMLTVGEDDRIGHALHYRLQARDGYLHVAHAVVVMLYLEETRKVTVGSCGKCPQLRQMCLARVLVELSEH